jgi:hypothetical protein
VEGAGGHRWRTSSGVDRRGAGVAGSERGDTAVGGIRGRKGGAVGGAPGSPAQRGVARSEGAPGSPVGGGTRAGGSVWVVAAWAGAAGAMGENERIRTGAMGDAGAGAMGDAGAGGIGLLSMTA